MKRFFCTILPARGYDGIGIGGIFMGNSLAQLPQGVPAKVLRLNCKKEYIDRLRDFGLVPGTQLTVRYRSPDRGVVALEFRGTVVAMRSRDLKGVQVQWMAER